MLIIGSQLLSHTADAMVIASNERVRGMRGTDGTPNRLAETTPVEKVSLTITTTILHMRERVHDSSAYTFRPSDLQDVRRHYQLL